MKPLLAALASLVLLAPAADAAKPDLVVSAGSVTATDTLTGTFVVKNRGGKRAPRSTAVVRAGRIVAGTAKVGRMKPGKRRAVTVDLPVPSAAGGDYPLRACADRGNKVRERNEGNNCRRVGTLTIQGGLPPQPPPPPAGGPPTDPVSFEKETVFMLESAQTPYWVFVPASYDESHQTPTKLLVWLHGCGGMGSGDIYTVSPGGNQSWISVAVGGREGECWDPNTDSAKVLAAIADVATHFNVDPRRVVLGGYSSGGDLAYRTAFYNSTQIAGVLAQNTSPFRDTGSSQQDSIAAATHKFDIVHLAQTGDTTYPIDGVRQETDALKAAGFPIERIERPGEHYDEQTDGYLQTLLLPHMDDGWTSP